MKITTSQVTKHLLTELEHLDPVTVICENFGSARGKIHIECFGDSWSHYWGSMGDGWTLERFFCSCDKHYLAGKLSQIDSTRIDWDGVPEALRKAILKLRRDDELTKSEAREFFDDASGIDSEFSAHNNDDLMSSVFGEEWWHCIPDMPNPKYEYLCRIVAAVQEALRSMAAQAMAS
jgi:hypothetical protein